MTRAHRGMSVSPAVRLAALEDFDCVLQSRASPSRLSNQALAAVGE
jgi:hypothetical protein